MSRIRIGWQPEAWIDQGPASARTFGYLPQVAAHGYAVTGGVLASGDSPQTHADHQRAWKARKAAAK